MSDGLHLARLPTGNNKRLLTRAQREKATGWWRVGGEMVQPTLRLPTCSALPMLCLFMLCSATLYSATLAAGTAAVFMLVLSRSVRSRLVGHTFGHARFSQPAWRGLRMVHPTLRFSILCLLMLCSATLCSVTLAAGTAAAFRLVRSRCAPRSLDPVGSGK